MMATLSLLFLLGASTLLWPASLQNVWILAVGAWIINFLFIICRLRSANDRDGRSIQATFLYWLLAYAAGFTWALLFATHVITSHVSDELAGEWLLVEGTINSIPKRDQQRTRFEFNIHNVSLADTQYSWHGKVLLSWYGQYPDMQVGEHWQLWVKLKQPRGLANPAGFDYEKWLLQQRIVATGYVREGSKHREAGNSINLQRQHMITTMRAVLDDSPFVGIITGLTVGIRDDMTAAQWQMLRNTGTSHLLAISGLHIGLVAGLAGFLLMRLWRLSAMLTLRIPAMYAGAIAALIAALFYSAMAGFAIPTQRALIMLIVFMLGVLFRRHLPLWHSYWLALLVVLIIDPLNVLAMGFWLSFAAVGILLYGLQGRIEFNTSKPKFWRQWGKAQWLVFVGLAPLTLLLFQQVPLISPLANVMAIPWVGFVTVPLSLLGSLSWFVDHTLAAFFWQLAALSLQPIIWLLEELGSFEILQWYYTPPSILVVMVAIIGSLLLLAPRGFPARYLGIMGLLPLWLYAVDKPKDGEVWLSILDVGQGLSVIVQTAKHVLVYDAGAKYSEQFDLGDSVVVPMLRQQGMRQVDHMVISHEHNDHAGGAISIIEQVDVAEIKTSVPDIILNVADLCVMGQHWQWDGVDFHIVYPTLEDLGRGNDSSCVLLIDNGHYRILLPGDIERYAEHSLLAKDIDISANILLAPHHGSQTSSSWEFLQAVSADYVVVSAGFKHYFGHPHRAVVERYQQLDMIMLNTAEHGMVQFKVRQDGISEPMLYRQQHGQFWQQINQFGSKPD